MFVYQIYVHMYGFLKYYVFYLFIYAVCCMYVCVSSIYVDMYGFMILNYHVLFYMCCMLYACYVMYVLFNV
jgi:hypothetical protein